MPPSDVEMSILRTVCWFSVFQYPVTGFEIWKWLLKPERAYSLEEVFSTLDTSTWLASRIQARHGQYHAQLGERFIEHVSVRQERYLDAVRKFKKMRRAGAFFRLFRAVRGVAAVNSLAFWNTTETSDMDMFVRTRKGTLWSTRFWLVAPFILLGNRPDASNAHDPFCFSFFADETVSVELFRLDDEDYYYAFWLKSIVPLLERDETFVRMEEEYSWVHTLLPNARMRRAHHHHRPLSLPHMVHIPSWTESVWRRLQHARFPSSIRVLANKDTRVVLTDEVLKFHDTDRREEFREMYRHRLTKLL